MSETDGRAGEGGRAAALPVELADLERRLADRTKVPARRLEEVLSWDDRRLRHEAEMVTSVLRRFTEAVVSSLDDADGARRFLDELDLRTIARDHDWRSVFAAMRAQTGAGPEHRRVLLVKYLQYLGFRKRLLEFVYARRRSLAETDDYGGVARAAAPRPGFDDLCRAIEEAPPGYRRLSMGESHDIDLRPGRPVRLRLGSHAFRLHAGQPPSLVDQHGVTCYLRSGRNLTGRHPESDLRLDQNFRDVSRVHCILEWHGGPRVTVIDLSSRGTFVELPAPAAPAL